MAANLHSTLTAPTGVSRTCAHCGGRLFLETEHHGPHLTYFMNCTNCARQFRMDGSPVRQPARVITPRTYPIPGRRRRALVGAY